MRSAIRSFGDVAAGETGLVENRPAGIVWHLSLSHIMHGPRQNEALTISEPRFPA